MDNSSAINWKGLIQAGLLAGLSIVYTGLIGMIQVFSEREIIVDLITLGQLLIFLPPFFAGYLVVKRRAIRPGAGSALLRGAVTGFFTALPPILLLWIISIFDIRAMFVNASPQLIELLSFGQGAAMGSVVLLAVAMGFALLGAAMTLLPVLVRNAIFAGLGWVLGVGLLSELITQILRNLFGNNAGRSLFTQGALKPVPALIIFVAAAILSVVWATQRKPVANRYASMSSGAQATSRTIGTGLLVIFLFSLPIIVGTYLSEVLSNVGLYVLMGLGLNIAVGLAGLLDLGYVTNFAVGAYVMGVLTSTGPLGVGGLNFWIVLPISVVAAMMTGFALALPVLRMRGDYLAIATLGFGEIIRLLALSDWLAPIIGGAQGILFIPKPQIGNFVFTSPQSIYYIILMACFIMLFISLRLNNSRTGRKWMSMREDEDAAGAMGIDTTVAKLLAFTLSAASGGLAGGIFAAKLGTIFPHSFSLLISINVLAIIIVGGMGSIPGIVVGALALIGLPELLREFSEFRLLIYGALLIVMMLTRPEGLWPSAVRRRELRVDETVAPVGAGD